MGTFKRNETSGRGRLSWLLVFLFMATLGYAQSGLKGTVVDQNGEPVVGAVVKSAANAKAAAVTNVNGQFSVNVKPGAQLRVTCVGYTDQTVSARQGMKITLAEAVNELDEYVVVGYGRVKKSDLTGSVASLNQKEFQDQAVTGGVNILAGRVAGLTVRSNDGNPNNPQVLRIRGANSIYGSNQPLIVVDGNYSSMPDAREIETLEVMKDASATAIYGSRGANGVIIITTKKGKEGKPVVKLNVDYSLSQIPKRYDMMNALEYATYHSEAGNYSWTQAEMDEFRANPKGTDWQDEMLQTGHTQKYMVTVSGGSKNVNYYIAPSYQKYEGTMRNNDSQSYDLRSRFEFKVNERLTVNVRMDAGRFEGHNSKYSSQSGTDTPLFSGLLWAPTNKIYREDGSYTPTGVGAGTFANPILQLYGVDRRQTNQSFSLVGDARLNILPGLDLTVKGMFSQSSSSNPYMESTEYRNSQTTPVSLGMSQGKSWLTNAYLNYDKTFAKVHNLSAMAGMEESRSHGLGVSGTGNMPASLEYNKWFNLGVAPSNNAGSSVSSSSLRSFFGRVNYNYAGRYYLTANFRADGSSNFAQGHKWGYFPSFSLAWRLTEEKFMKDQDVFQNIKIRGGWGATGNQDVGSYATLSSFNDRSTILGGPEGSRYTGMWKEVSGNTDLKWETTKQFNVGLDLTFCKGRMNLTVDYYKKKTTDLLAPMFVPAYNGGVSSKGKQSIISNIGSTSNEGFEVNFNYQVVNTKDFTYDFNINGGYNKNEVLDIGDNSYLQGEGGGGAYSDSPFAIIKGEPIGTFYGLHYLGIWQQDQAAEAAKYGQQPGDYHYEDFNGDGGVDNNDYQVLGNSNPKFTWGFNNHFTYKGFDLNILFEGVHGRKLMNYSRMFTCGNISLTSHLFGAKDGRDRWTPENPGAEFGREAGAGGFQYVSDQHLENGDYIKLRNISLGYTLPKQWLKVAEAKLTFSVQNLFTISSYKGLDPEVSAFDNPTASQIGGTGNFDVSSGMDWFCYPNPRSYSLSVQFTF